VPKERLDVHIDGEVLVIEGEMGLEMPKEMEATHVEVGLPRYRRVFTLSRELDPMRMHAELKQGVLKVRIQRAEHAKARRIEVSG
jgi:HSP20 family molecular chaperone IbpA